MLYLMCSHYDILHDIQHMLILYDVELVVLNNTLEIQSMYIFKACVQTSICKSNIQCVIVVVVFAILTYMYTGYCWFDHAYVGFPKRGHRTDLVQYLVMFRCIIHIYLKSNPPSPWTCQSYFGYPCCAKEYHWPRKTRANRATCATKRHACPRAKHTLRQRLACA
jgi:hypothetical protein